ncbi:uncharacterized protein VTP21DRAFT_10886 [Calcarisporiella thermophila]|uniref:uncharacterized protein n=1 Tax=Calcarisporiella thermophila TaxID=911321 RepID=UPI00374267BD
MSFDIHWEKLDASVGAQVKAILNRHFSSIRKPDFLGDIEIAEFSFGTIPPQIEIVEIGDPFPEFYLPSDDELEEDEETAELDDDGRDRVTGRDVMLSEHEMEVTDALDRHTSISEEGPFRISHLSSRSSRQDHQRDRNKAVFDNDLDQSFMEDRHSNSSQQFGTSNAFGITRLGVADEVESHYFASSYLSTTASERHSLSRRTSASDGSYLEAKSMGSRPHNSGRSQQSMGEESEAAAAEAEKENLDAQVQVQIQYKGNMRLTILTELRVNYPSVMFMALPVQLTVTGLSFNATAVIAYLRRRINFCFLEPSDPKESLLTDIRIESEIGDKKKQVLKNVGKVERFIVEQLRKFIDEDFVFPSYHSIRLDP